MSEASRPAAPIEVRWEGGMRYRGGPAGGPTLLLDGERVAAPSPVEGLVVSLAACAAIDVVEILAKRRTPATALTVRAEYQRASEPPRRITGLELVFRVTTASERTHVERAVELSFEKYCSVVHTLARDIRLAHRIELIEPEMHKARDGSASHPPAAAASASSASSR